jgi:two-component system nitrogen regulation sensor histidine kinase NtrY
MLFDKLKYRLIVGFVIIAVLPAIPLSLLFQNMTKKVFSAGFNSRVESALEDGMEFSQQVLDKENRIFTENARHFTESIELKTFLFRYLNRSLSKSDYDSFLKSDLFERYQLDGAAIYDHQQQMIFKALIVSDPLMDKSLQDSASIAEALRLNKPQTHYIENAHHFLIAVPLLSNQQIAVFTAVRMVEAPLAQKLDNIFSVLQFYRTFESERKDTIQSFVYTFVLTYSVFLVLSIGLGIFFSNIMTNPIHTLALGTHEISSGNLDYHIDMKPRKDEIGKLMTSFNQMVTSIKQERERVIYLEKMAAWREIAQRMAHEIKNPLTPIQLTVQQIKDAYHGDDENYKKLLNECSGIIEEEIQSLKNLTREFSDFARMPSLSPKPTLLNQLIKDVAAIYASTPFRIQLDDTASAIEIDPEAVKRVLINLIDNALAALVGKPNGLITITTQNRDEHVRLLISDNGHGIPKEHFHRIFEPHFSTKSTGMGLGLAIVKNILDEQKAEISVHSVENFGTTFTIDFKKTFSIFSDN